MSAELPAKTAESLRRALGAEYAAVWMYGLATAFVSDDTLASDVAKSATAHRARRDAARRLFLDAGLTPPPADPAYRPPRPVVDQTSALRVLVVAEEDCAVGWRAVLEHSAPAASGGQPSPRSTALDGLTGAATRATRLRLALGEQPAATAFPGLRDRT